MFSTGLGVTTALLCMGKNTHRDDIRTQRPLPSPTCRHRNGALGPTNGVGRCFAPFSPEIVIPGRRHRSRREQGWELRGSSPSPSPLTLYFVFQSTLVYPNSAPWCLILTTNSPSSRLEPPLCLCSPFFYRP